MTRAEEDQRLLSIILEAQRHPAASLQRRRALNQWIALVMATGRLYRPSRSRIPPQCQGAYQEICNDAQQELMLWVCQNVDKYDPEKASVMGWLNMLMDRRFVTVGLTQFQDKRERRLGKRRRLQDLMRAEDDIPAPEPKDSNHAELRQFIDEDPKGFLRSKKLRDRPEITFQRLLQWRLADRTWDDIATEFDLSLQTLHSFFRRSLKSLSPELREQLAY